ncbi:MAG TPA: alanine racemase [Candidatus Sulfotelmatobacter sp.]|jgi:alanine racemase|nr:alanine racemase [Candidatus Sulfotelmatobacter sp.]
MTRGKKNQSSPDFIGRPVWAEVSLSALSGNLRAIRNYVNPATEKRKTPRKVLSIVKGNAYGHGGAQVAKALEKAGSDWFGVASAGEGIEIRKAGVRTPILVLGGFWPGEEKNLLQHNLTPAIHRCEQLLAFEAAAAKLRKKNVAVQLKIDTGMNRLGIMPKDADCFARQLAKCKHVTLAGTFTHLASSEVLTDTELGHQTRQQLDRFYSTVERLRFLGADPGILHIANSAAIAARPETWADMVRPGAILYGYHPGFDPPERRKEFETKLPLRPVMSLRARLMSVRSIAPGEAVGYDATWIAQRPSRIAVLSAGYADGVHRSLGNQGVLYIRGHAAPIIGIVSMDVVMLDVTDVPDAAVGDVATLYGTDGDNVYPANVVARSIGTVTSDLISGVSQRVPRFYLP